MYVFGWQYPKKCPLIYFNQYPQIINQLIVRQSASMKPLLNPEKVALAYFASIERDVTRLYKTAYPKDIQSQQRQLELLKQILLGYLNSTNNKENQCSNTSCRDLDFEDIPTQQQLIEKDEKIERLKKQMEIQFEMTRNFVNLFKKQSEETLKQLKEEKLNTRDSLKNMQNLNINRLRTSSSLVEPMRLSITDRDFPPQNPKHEQVLEQNKTLAKLNKLEKFLYKPKTVKPEKAALANVTWNFSPTKADYKRQNENLKILHENLRIQLDHNPVKGDETTRKQRIIVERQRKCHQQEQSLFKKEMELNKRHMLILRRQKRLKTLA